MGDVGEKQAKGAEVIRFLRTIQYRYLAWQFRRFTRHFDAQIKAARADHAKVNHIKAAKQEFLHDALRAGR